MAKEQRFIATDNSGLLNLAKVERTTIAPRFSGGHGGSDAYALLAVTHSDAIEIRRFPCTLVAGGADTEAAMAACQQAERAIADQIADRTILVIRLPEPIKG